MHSYTHLKIKIILLWVMILSTFAGTIKARTATVSTFSELMTSVENATSGDTILLRDGTYTVNNGYGAQIRKNNLTIKSYSNEREKVVINGGGMSGGTQYGFWIPGSNVTIQSLTIQNVTAHCIQTDANNHGLHVINCVLRDAYQQLLKIPAGSGKSDSGVVEGCLFEFTKGVAENFYTGGIDCHRGKDWIVRNNTFKNIRSPAGSIAEHAIHFWNNSENIIAENNLIIDCDRGIGFGMGQTAVHQGGIIRNNIIYHRTYPGTDFGDVGIALENCVDVKIYNNTIYFDNTYPNAIEYRFPATSGAYIANNLTNKSISQRDNASGTVSNNVTNAQPGWFVSTSTGNLHLSSGSVSSVIDKGVAIEGFTKDIDGNTRPQGAGIDIGADEYSSSSVKIESRNEIQKSAASRPGKVLLFNKSGSKNPVSSVKCIINQKQYDLKGSRVH